MANSDETKRGFFQGIEKFIGSAPVTPTDQSSDEAAAPVIPGGERIIYCTNCGQQQPENVKFCMNCGSSTVVTEKGGAETRRMPANMEASGTPVSQAFSISSIIRGVLNLHLLEGILVGLLMGTLLTFTFSWAAPLGGMIYLILRGISRVKTSRLFLMAFGAYLGIIGAVVFWLGYRYGTIVLEQERIIAVLLGYKVWLMMFIIIPGLIYIMRTYPNTLIKLSLMESYPSMILLIAVLGGVLASLVNIFPSMADEWILLFLFATAMLYMDARRYKSMAVLLLAFSAMIGLLFWKGNYLFIYNFQGPITTLRVVLEPLILILVASLSPLMIWWTQKRWRKATNLEQGAE